MAWAYSHRMNGLLRIRGPCPGPVSGISPESPAIETESIRLGYIRE